MWSMRAVSSKANCEALDADTSRPTAMVKDYTPTCRYYCHGEKTCRRIDCMSCDGCNASASIAHATRRIREYEQVNCSKTDGSFTLGASRWPAPYHFLDGGLAPFLLEFIGEKTLLDVGAGSGQYGAWFESKRQHGAMNVPLWRGVDGAKDIENFTRHHGPPGSLVTHANLCDRSLSLEPSDWVMSLEVGEHLPEQCLDTYCRLLAKTAKVGMLLSWARPGQDGKCHISTRTEDWVRESFLSLGWALDEAMTERARNASQLPWLRLNAMVLRPQRTGWSWFG